MKTITIESRKRRTKNNNAFGCKSARIGSKKLDRGERKVRELVRISFAKKYLVLSKNKQVLACSVIFFWASVKCEKRRNKTTEYTTKVKELAENAIERNKNKS